MEGPIVRTKTLEIKPSAAFVAWIDQLYHAELIKRGKDKSNEVCTDALYALAKVRLGAEVLCDCNGSSTGHHLVDCPVFWQCPECGTVTRGNHKTHCDI